MSGESTGLAEGRACAMAKTGKVYENLMINLKPSNVKLRSRVIRITSAILGIPEDEAEAELEKHGFDIRATADAYKKNG